METKERELFEKAEKLVEREVIYCVSHLISGLSLIRDHLENPEVINKIDWEIWQGPPSIGDYEGTCPECDQWIKLGDMEPDEGFLTCPECGFDEVDGLDFEVTEYREVFEHWIVSKYLAERLEEQGETVVSDFMGMDIWARCCSGQSISCDGVIQRIANDMY